MGSVWANAAIRAVGKLDGRRRKNSQSDAPSGEEGNE